MTKPRDLYPLPVHGMFNHPAFAVMSPAACGMLLRILEHYWRGGCRWYPTTDLQMSQWAQAHMRTWKLHKAAIYEVFHAIRPELDGYHAKREGGRLGLINGAHAVNSARRLEAMRENTARAQARRLELSGAGMTPRREANPAPRPVAPDKRPPRPKFSPTV